MKEQTIEQKAQKYDEAIKRAREWSETKNGYYMPKELCEEIFPELKESEDEKIRKELITHCRNTRCVTEEGAERIAKWIAWLEKQGNIDFEFFENEEDEKREFVGYGFLKCKGDFLSFKEGETYWLEYVGKDNYNVRSDNLLGQTFHITPQQLYTVFRPTTWLEKQCEQKSIDDLTQQEAMDIAVAKCFEQGEQKSNEEYNITGIGSKHAQGKLAEMIKKLKPVNRALEQNPAWSEEDEERLQSCLNVLQGRGIMGVTETVNTKWLKSLKDRVQPQQKQDWKQENIEELSDFENAMMHIGGSFFGENAGLDPNNTACIKEQANLLLELIPKQEWSEEDKKKVNNLYVLLDQMIRFNMLSNKDASEFKDWLKSLKAKLQPKQEWSEEEKARIDKIVDVLDWAEEKGYIRYSDWEDYICYVKSLRPQNRWKPSEGQLECLGYAIEKAKDWSPLTNNRVHLTLKALEEQLKKLREE